MTDMPRRGFGCQPLINDLKEWTRPLLGKRGFSCVDIIERWADVVGADLSRGVRPEKIAYPHGKRSDGTLHVACQGGAFATLLEHRKKIVLERINTFLGYAAVCDIKIRQGAFCQAKPDVPKTVERPLPETVVRSLREKVENIADEHLQQAVFRLGEAIFQKEA